MVAHTEIVIAGGGLVGATLAVALKSVGIEPLVIEAHPPSAGQPSFDDRATALARSSRDILDTLGLWTHIEGASPIRTIHVTDQGRFGATRLDSASLDVDAFGYVVENRELGRVLWERLASDGIQVESPARIVDVRSDIDAIRLTVASDAQATELATGLLVVAEGAASHTRSLLGAGVETEDYGRVALVANVRAEKSHGGRAFERFTADGPLAVLPLSGGRCNVVWSLTAERAAQLVDNDEAYRDGLQDAFGYRLGRIVRVGQRFSYPLIRSVSRPLHGRRWVLVGNAANGVHPVAGQGFNLGLRDVAALAEKLSEARGDVDSDVLMHYAQWRKPDHRHVLTSTDALARVFTNPAPGVGALRDAALVTMQLVPAMRRYLAWLGMGYVGQLPRLARGVALS